MQWTQNSKSLKIYMCPGNTINTSYVPGQYYYNTSYRGRQEIPKAMLTSPREPFLPLSSVVSQIWRRTNP